MPLTREYVGRADYGKLKGAETVRTHTFRVPLDLVEALILVAACLTCSCHRAALKTRGTSSSKRSSLQKIHGSLTSSSDKSVAVTRALERNASGYDGLSVTGRTRGTIPEST